MDAFHKAAVTTALKEMFNGNYFSISTVDKCIKITGCIPNKKDYQALSALHCVDWSDMDKELRQLVFVKTMEIFDNPGFDIELLGQVMKNDSLLLN